MAGDVKLTKLKMKNKKQFAKMSLCCVMPTVTLPSRLLNNGKHMLK